MWESLSGFPRGRVSLRNFMTFFATVIVASFGYLLAVSTPVFAADATWNGDNITYEGNSYKPVDTPAPLQQAFGSTQMYEYSSNATSGTARDVSFIYFPSGATPKASGEANYVLYTLNPPNGYSNPRDGKSITIDPSSVDSSTSVGETSCDVDGVGWLVCGLGGYIADGVDVMYEVIASFLIVQPISGGNNSLYRLWDVMRNIANVLFVIGFLVVIYSYLAGGGFNGYEIRRILPRVVLAAILINVSYWICAVAVDASNIVGASLQQLLINIRETAVGTEVNTNVGWGEITTYILSGGTIGVIGFLAATGGSITSFAFLLLGILIVIVFALFVAFVILAARQAIIIILIIIAPIAFAAFILPNTEKWFDRWRGIFTTMLMMFPIFSLLFGGSQLAGAAIIQNAPNLAIMLFGMAIQIVPLVITPLLIKFSGGLLGRIAGMVNNAEKGILDRGKGWAGKQQEYHKDRALANDNRWYNFARRGGQAMYRGGKNREDRQKNYQSQAENRRHATRAYGRIDTARRDIEGQHDNIKAHHDEHYSELLARGGDRRAIQSQTRMMEGRTKYMNAAMEAQDDRRLQNSINEDSNFAYVKNMRIQTAVDKGLADNVNKLIESQGNAQLSETVLASSALKGQVIKTQEYQGRASQANELVEDAAKANWQNITLDDRTVYSRQLERQANAKNLKSLQDEWESILVEASAGRTDDYQRRHGPVTQQVSAQIDTIRQSEEIIAVEEKRKASADYVAKVNLTQQLKANDALLDRAAGIDEQGRTKIIADLTKAGSTLHMKEVEAIESLMSNEGYELEEEKLILQGKKVRNMTNAPTAAERHAAMRRILLTNGNNWAAQEVYDYVVSQGMRYDKTANGGNGAYYDENGIEITDVNEVSSRRDLQQIYIDADSKSGLKVDYLSGTQKGEAQAGLLQRPDPSRTASEQAIIDDITKAKIKGERIAAADIDVIDRQVQTFMNPANVAALPEDSRRKYVETLNRTLEDHLLGGRMAEREWARSKILANMLDDTDTRPMSEKMTTYVNRKGETITINATPNNYTYIR